MSSSELSQFVEKVKDFRAKNPKSHYPKSFQKSVLKFIESGYSARNISKLTGIHQGSITKWQQARKPQAFAPAVIIENNKLESKLTVITGISLGDLTTVLKSLP